LIACARRPSIHWPLHGRRCAVEVMAEACWNLSRERRNSCRYHTSTPKTSIKATSIGVWGQVISSKPWITLTKLRCERA